MMPDAADKTSCPASRILRDVGPYEIAQSGLFSVHRQGTVDARFVDRADE